jgi:hypothetical protein
LEQNMVSFVRAEFGKESAAVFVELIGWDISLLNASDAAGGDATTEDGES